MPDKELNTCILCGEPIPEHRLVCGTCTAILDSLPPERAKKLQKVIEHEEARTHLRVALQEVKQQMRDALAPFIAALLDFIDLVIDVTGVVDDGE